MGDPTCNATLSGTEKRIIARFARRRESIFSDSSLPPAAQRSADFRGISNIRSVGNEGCRPFPAVSRAIQAVAQPIQADYRAIDETMENPRLHAAPAVCYHSPGGKSSVGVRLKRPPAGICLRTRLPELISCHSLRENRGSSTVQRGRSSDGRATDF